MLSAYPKDAAEDYEQQGQAALAAYLARVQGRSYTRLFLFDSQLQELSGVNLPPDARDVARRVFQTQLPEFADRGRPPLLGRPVQSDGGKRYALVAELPPRPEFALFHLHLVAMALVGAIF